MAKAQKWEELTRGVAFRKYSQTVECRDYKLPSGEIADYYIRVEKAGACALALTTDHKVITIPQYRPGPNMILTELPGGQVDNDESPRKAAVRELLEETGYAGNVEDWIGKWHTDAYTQSDRSIIIVKDCKKITDARLDSREFGEVELLDLVDFVAQARKGLLTDTAGAMLALDHLDLLK
jgi:ADP-ribose pyrophosphatase